MKTPGTASDRTARLGRLGAANPCPEYSHGAAVAGRNPLPPAPQRRAVARRRGLPQRQPDDRRRGASRALGAGPGRVGCGAGGRQLLLGCAGATTCTRYLYVYFVSHLAVTAACAYILATVLGRVDELKSLQYSSRAPSWRDDARLLGVSPGGLQGCDADAEELSQVCWEALRPALLASRRRAVVRGGSALLSLQLLALLAAKWALTLPVIVVKTEIAIAYATLTLATILALAAGYQSSRVQTAFGSRLVGWCAGAAALLFVQSVWV